MPAELVRWVCWPPWLTGPGGDLRAGQCTWLIPSLPPPLLDCSHLFSPATPGPWCAWPGTTCLLAPTPSMLWGCPVSWLRVAPLRGDRPSSWEAPPSLLQGKSGSGHRGWAWTFKREASLTAQGGKRMTVFLREGR